MLNGKVEYQKALGDGAALKEDIQIASVNLEMAQLEVKELEDASLMLNDKRERLQEERKEAD